MRSGPFLNVIAAHNGVLMVHSEDNDIVSDASAPLIKEGFTDPFYHGIARPFQAEVKAIKELGAISQRTDCKIYIVHLNSSEGLQAALEFPKLLIETCPHYLFFDENLYNGQLGRMYVASPPLRTQTDNQELWNALLSNTIQTVGSDHCPFCLADKQEGIPFQDIPNGMAGVETSFPIMLARFLEQNQDISILARMQSENPARIFGLYPRKGVIRIGSDADLVIANPQALTSRWDQRLVSITDWNGYSGLPAVFPEHVILRGKLLLKNNRIIQNGMGQFITGKIDHQG